MDEAALDLGWAIGIDAAPGSSEITSRARHSLDFAIALRTTFWKFKDSFLTSAFGEDDTYHRRNYLPRFLNGDGITNADVLAAKFVFVVQGGVGYCHAPPQTPAQGGRQG